MLVGKGWFPPPVKPSCNISWLVLFKPLSGIRSSLLSRRPNQSDRLERENQGSRMKIVSLFLINRCFPLWATGFYQNSFYRLLIFRAWCHRFAAALTKAWINFKNGRWLLLEIAIRFSTLKSTSCDSRIHPLIWQILHGLGPACAAAPPTPLQGFATIFLASRDFSPLSWPPMRSIRSSNLFYCFLCSAFFICKAHLCFFYPKRRHASSALIRALLTWDPPSPRPEFWENVVQSVTATYFWSVCWC